MIFVTVGTDHHPFSRIFDWLRHALDEGVIAKDERIVVQHGYTEGDWNGFEAHRFLSFAEMVGFFQEAELVITHGSSTALLVAHHNKLPLIVARRKHLGEHINDHQWLFVTGTRDVLPFTLIETKEDFIKALLNRDKITRFPEGFEVGGKAAVERFACFFQEMLQKE